MGEGGIDFSNLLQILDEGEDGQAQRQGMDDGEQHRRLRSSLNTQDLLADLHDKHKVSAGKQRSKKPKNVERSKGFGDKAKAHDKQKKKEKGIGGARPGRKQQKKK